MRRNWTPSEDAQLHELAGTVSADRIAAILGRPKGGVHHRIKKLGLSGTLSGEHHWNAKSDKLQAAMLWTLRDAGFTALEIKRALKVDLSTDSIDDIGACRTWRR